jgi:hypothetical protein
MHLLHFTHEQVPTNVEACWHVFLEGKPHQLLDKPFAEQLPQQPKALALQTHVTTMFCHEIHTRVLALRALWDVLRIVPVKSNTCFILASRNYIQETRYGKERGLRSSHGNE